MAISMECYNIIIPKTVIASKYPGGILQFKKEGGEGILEDEFLVRAGAMNWFDVEEIIRHLERCGIRYQSENGGAADMVVVDMNKGPLIPCDWLEFDKVDDGPRCWLRGTSPGSLSQPDRRDNVKDGIIAFEMRNGMLHPASAKEESGR